MQNEDGPGRESHVDRPECNWARRRVLAGVGATGLAVLAGCSSGGSGDGDGDDEIATAGSNADGGSDSGTAGSDDSGGDGTGSSPAAMGEVIEGRHVSLVVEYARPVDEVVDFSDFPQRHEEERYGVPRTISYYASQGFTDDTTDFYAIGLAVKNTHDRAVDVSTIMLESDGSGAVMTFPGRGQRLTFHGSGHGRSMGILPGEFARGEVVFALSDDPSGYRLRVRPFEIGTGDADPIVVDLGRGAEGTASFTQEIPTRQYGSPAPVGDFDVTLHSVERLASIEDSPHQEYFGPREGYEYLRVDCSATRTSDEMIGQGWFLGMTDDDGYGFHWSTVYQDVYDINRTRLEQLSIGDSLENTVFAFPVDTSFDPTYLTMNAFGPFEEPPNSGSVAGSNRIAWALD